MVGGTFLVVAVLLVLFWVAAWLWAVTNTQDAWDQIGKGGFELDSDADRQARETPAERDADLQALRAARAARHAARGERAGTPRPNRPPTRSSRPRSGRS